MDAHEILVTCRDKGVQLEVQGDKLRAHGKLTDELRNVIRQHKAELIAELTQPTDEDRICELLHRYHLGEFHPKVRERLAEIFRENPPDAEERLLRACEHLGVDGSQLQAKAEEAMVAWRQRLVSVVNIKTLTKAERREAVYIGRATRYHQESPLHNPYKAPRDGTREECLELYRQRLHSIPHVGCPNELGTAFMELEHKVNNGGRVTLTCPCKSPCHGDVLKEALTDPSFWEPAVSEERVEA